MENTETEHKYQMKLKDKDGNILGYVYPKQDYWVARAADSNYSASFINIGEAVETLYRLKKNISH